MPRQPKRSTRNIRWIEEHCRIPEGRDVGKRVKLRPWQRRELVNIYDTPTRRFIFSVGRKNAKTALACFLVLLHTVGPEATPNGQLYSAAQSREQAAILFNLAAKVVRQSPTLEPELVIRDSAKEIFCPALGTRYKALSAEAATAYGLSPSVVVHDELGQVRGPRSPLYDALETAVAAQASPLSIVISTQAPNDDDLLSLLIDDALKGRDPRVKISLYTADPDDDPFDEKTIRKANPAFGDFQNAVEVMAMAEDARAMPSREAEFRNLVLNQRIEANDPYIAPALWKACAGPVAADWRHLPAFGGLDLSAVNDLTAFVRVAWVGGELHARCTFWLPAENLRKRAEADRVPYDLWADRGLIETTPGSAIEYREVAPRVLAIMRAEEVAAINFDRWNFRNFRPWLLEAGATEDELERFVEFGQGFASMSPALRNLDEVLLNGKLRHGGHEVLEMCAKNAIVVTDPAGNRKLTKAAPKRRIDGIVALAMATSAAMAAEPEGSTMDDYFASLAGAA